jgi:hypothetical protein
LQANRRVFKLGLIAAHCCGVALIFFLFLNLPDARWGKPAVVGLPDLAEAGFS